MKPTPHLARIYLLIAAFFIVLPSLTGLYSGHSGKLLVATSKVPPGPFYRSVVYIAGHNVFSAGGYSVNVPREGGDFLGGPLAKERAVFMSRDESGGIVFASAEAEGFARKIYGYAGWGPLQLNYEIARGGWDVIEYDPVLVFDTPVERIWEAARERVFEKVEPADGRIL